MSQNVDIGPSFIFIPKKREDFDHFFHDYFSSFHKTKTRNYIKTRRHCSLKMTVLIRHLKFYFEGGVPACHCSMSNGRPC